MPRDRWAALEADLLAVGMTLDDYPSRLSLRALVNFIRYPDRGSRLMREVHGAEAVNWGQTEELLAVIAEVLRDGNWQRGGNPRAPKPPPLPRPKSTANLRPAARAIESKPGVKHFGGPGMSIAEFEKRWAA